MAAEIGRLDSIVGKGEYDKSKTKVQTPLLMFVWLSVASDIYMIAPRVLLGAPTVDTNPTQLSTVVLVQSCTSLVLGSRFCTCE